MTFYRDVQHAGYLVFIMSRSGSKVSVAEQCSTSRDETAAKALASVVRKVNVYTAGGLWRIGLNYIRQTCVLYAKVVGATSSEGL